MKTSPIILLLIFSSFQSNLYESAPSGSDENELENKENAKLCINILEYIHISEKLSRYSEESFKKKCSDVIKNIKKNIPHNINEQNEFILSLIHTRSLHASEAEEDEYALTNIISKLENNKNLKYINKKARNIIRYNKFILEISDTKDVEEFLVLRSEKDEYMWKPKENIVKNIKESFKYHSYYFQINENEINLKSEVSHINFIEIYKENICLHNIHLCQKFYQQVEIYLKMKAIFLNIMSHIGKKCKLISKEDILKVLSMKKKKEDVIQILDEPILEGDLYVIENIILNKKEENLLELHKLDNKKNKKIIYAHKAAKIINIKKELNNKEKYEELMNSVKTYLLSITSIDKDISAFVEELDNDDIEKFLTDLNFFIYYGFLFINEDKSWITEEDVIPTFVNLYRANNIVFLYILKTAYEENKNSEHLAYNFYNLNKFPYVESRSLINNFKIKNEYTNLKELDKKKVTQHFTKNLTEFLKQFKVSPSDSTKIQFFFKMAFKDCNINQNYSKDSMDLWLNLLYTYDKFGWFYVHPNDVIESIKKEHFVRHILSYRNFNLKNGHLLMYLDTQVSKLVDLIHLALKMDKSLYSLDFSLDNNFFKYGNDFHILKTNILKTKFSYDYADSIANNYFFFDEKKNDVFNTMYNNKYYKNIPNIYSLAYQLFNELAININVITNTPLKRRLKDKSSYAYFTILNIIGKNHDIYSKSYRYVFASYILALVFFIESHIDISRYKPKDLFFLKQSYPLIEQKYADAFLVVKKRCSLLYNFINIKNNSDSSELSHLEEVMKILSLVIIVLWGKESKKSLYYDKNVSLYKKLMISCIFNGGKSIQEKLVEDITNSCDISFYGLTPKILVEIIEINLSINKWNPVTIEKLAYSFVLNCKLQINIYDSMNMENISLKNFSKLAVAPELLKTYHCFKLGRQAAKLLESIILKKKFVRFRVNDAIDVYDFFYIKKVVSKNVAAEFKEFLRDKAKYEKKQTEIIMQSSPLTEEQTKNLIDNYSCYWFSNFENFRTLWMHVSSKLGTGTYIKNFFSEIWANIHYIFKKKKQVKDVEYFPVKISELNLLDFYSPLVISEIYCQEQMQIFFFNLKDNKEENRSEIPDKIKTAYFQCKYNYYKENHSDFIHRIQPNHFMNKKVYVIKQPYYLIHNIDNVYETKLIRLFLTEKTLDYLLMDDINIPECFGRCTTKHFNRVILEDQNPKERDVIIKNALVPEHNLHNKRKKMIIYVNESYVHNLNTDYLTKERIRKIDIENNSVKVCMGKSTYFLNSFLNKSHFNLSHKPVYDFPPNHNFLIFLKKNEHLINKNPNHECFINYDLSINNLDVEDPYHEISEDLIKNLYILKNK
ncbi:high molecular weight rhoptry protein 2, putative [Plasmodium relictum]|uniref:High molecular weight rhoptry protein 2, putative n=1 Tax=Plasmodium relictum TaxID=85471 RepID=A0A1J1H438_PLARL|nr:high molecular weight rhoptry protein 2, putative [Plasmodium relictum]CRG99505.1 high molecular weight rhoptry protein 2, putative [Plasmodium relictum]